MSAKHARKERTPETKNQENLYLCKYFVRRARSCHSRQHSNRPQLTFVFKI